MLILRRLSPIMFLAVTSTPAFAIDVVFDGIVTNNCILSVDTDGDLGFGTDGTTLSSELGEGRPAIVVVAALGAGPQVTVASPTFTEPAGQSAPSTPAIRYTSLSGANQSYTDQTTTSSAFLADIYTINARLSNENGFVAGNYSVTTEVTCGYAP